MALMLPPLELTDWQLFFRWTFYIFLQVDHLNSQPGRLVEHFHAENLTDRRIIRGESSVFCLLKRRMSLLGMQQYPWTLGDVMIHHKSLGNLGKKHSLTSERSNISAILAQIHGLKQKVCLFDPSTLPKLNMTWRHPKGSLCGESSGYFKEIRLGSKARTRRSRRQTPGTL